MAVDEGAILAAIDGLKQQVTSGQPASDPGQEPVQTTGAGQQPVSPPVAPVAPSPPSPPQINEQQVGEIVFRLSGGRTRDPSQLQTYIQNADAVIAATLEAEQHKRAQTQQVQLDKTLSREILDKSEEIRKQGGTTADLLAWIVQESAAAGAEVADKRVMTRAQQQAAAAQRSQEGRVAFFNDHQDLIQHTDKVDALVAKGIHPVEAARLIRDLIPAGAPQAAPGQPAPQPAQSVSAPNLTREQVEAILRGSTATTPAILDKQQGFKDSAARKKMIDEIEGKMGKAESAEDVWAALRAYKPG